MSSANTLTFTVLDYVILCIVLILSGAIGIYYSIRGGKTSDYTVGGRQMGAPAEVYKHGWGYIIWILNALLTTLIINYVYLPVFYNLKITSIYEYLELRFNALLQRIISIFYLISTVFLMAIVIYAPALSLVQATGYSLWSIIIVMSTICLFYSTFGGIKGIIYADIIQFIFMIGCVLMIVIVGFQEVGGITKVWNKNLENNKLEINFQFDLSIRYSFWASFFGGGINILTKFAVMQETVQRYFSVSTLAQARVAVWNCIFGFILFIVLTAAMGLILFAAFADCDPLLTKQISSQDQLVLFFVLKYMSGKYIGFSGFFVAALFSSSVSTLSSQINSVATITFKQLVQPFFTVSEHRSIIVMKLLSFFFGILSVISIPLIQQMGGIFPAVLSLLGIQNGPVLALFTLGLLCPWVNAFTASIGIVMGFDIPSWFFIGSLVYKNPSLPKPKVAVDDCNFSHNFLNETFGNKTLNMENEMFRNQKVEILPIYNLSLLYYGLIGFVITIIISLILSSISYLRKKPTTPVAMELISPIVRKFMNWPNNSLEMNQFSPVPDDLQDSNSKF